MKEVMYKNNPGPLIAAISSSVISSSRRVHLLVMVQLLMLQISTGNADDANEGGAILTPTRKCTKHTILLFTILFLIAIRYKPLLKGKIRHFIKAFVVFSIYHKLKKEGVPNGVCRISAYLLQAWLLCLPRESQESFHVVWTILVVS